MEKTSYTKTEIFERINITLEKFDTARLSKSVHPADSVTIYTIYICIYPSVHDQLCEHFSWDGLLKIDNISDKISILTSWNTDMNVGSEHSYVRRGKIFCD